MTSFDVILTFLKDNGGMYCDDCLSKLCGITPRQQVNQVCNKASENGRGIRKVYGGVCKKCGGRKICREADVGDTLPPSHSACNATYEEIRDYTKEHYGFVPKTCWIADVKEQCGLPVNMA